MRRLCPTISELNAFHAAAKHLSFTLAARELCVTQSAISRHVAALEEYLSAKLFVRSAAGLRLTEAGQTYLGATQPALEALEIATAQMRSQGASGGELTVSVPPTFATQWLLPRMGEFRRALPQFTLHFARYQHVPNFYGLVEFDAAIAFGQGHWPNAVAHYIAGRQQVVVCTPQLRDELALNAPADVLRTTLLQHIEVPAAWSDWMQAHGLETSGSRFGPGFTQYALILKAAQAGFGVGVVPRCMAEYELESGSLVALFDDGYESAEGYYLCTSPAKAQSSAFRAFKQWLEHCCFHAPGMDAAAIACADCSFCQATVRSV